MGLSGKWNRWKRGKGVTGVSKEVSMKRVVAIQLGKEEMTRIGVMRDLKGVKQILRMRSFV